MRSLFLLLILIGVCSALTLPALAETVDLRRAERMALERNLKLRAQAFDTRASEALIRKGYGVYDPQLELVLAEGKTRDLSNRQDFTAATGIDNRQFDFSLSQTIPYGGEFLLEFLNRRDRFFTPPEPLVNPEYDSELKLSLIQPLLRNFGQTVTEQEILFAVKDRNISIEDLREQAFQLLAQVRDAYFDVLRLRDDLSYRETSVALASKVLEENRARVDAGVLPPVELLEAEVGLKNRERDLLEAQREHLDALDNLALLLNFRGELEVPADELGQPEFETDEEQGFRLALQKRPDFLRRMKEIDRLDLENTIADNQLHPALDVFASYGYRGVGEDYSDDLDLLFSDDLRNWSVGATFSYPIGNREARNELLRTQLRLKGQYAQLGQLKEEILRDIRAAIRLLDVNRKKIEVTDRGQDLAEEKLRTLLKRKEVGLATTRQVLEGEEDLALAHTDYIAALADYNKAITEYLRVSGLLLEHEGVHFAGALDLDSTDSLMEMDAK